MFTEVSGLQQNWEGGIEISHTCPGPTRAWSLQSHLSEWYIFYQGWASLWHHNHPKTIVYINLHSSYCMWRSQYPSNPLLYLQSIFCSKNTLCSAHSTFPTLASGNCSPFYCLYTLAFSRMSYGWNLIICSLFRLASFN